ncbi:hypothetical protein [Sphingobacterium humi]|uniref:Phosphatidate cytidylyltransferase n=1 Tax=Sphingobacterium humi TaxID=1796905 RepID=A0A6N8L2P7_9SPHI|nr:hypothetical protein [Sphingobacterium humi]MVZ62428.1 hypothetical protein [Sphingobacterium humi]
MNRIALGLMVVLGASLLGSCSVIEGIFKAGVWSGIIMVVLVVVLIIWLIAKFAGRGGRD